MTGHRLRTDCREFRRKLSRETLDFHDFSGFLEKSLHHRVPPTWFLETPAASKLILGGPSAPLGPLSWDPLGSLGSPPMGFFGLPRVPSHGIPWAPLGPLPWDPLGSLGSPPIGSLGFPRGRVRPLCGRVADDEKHAGSFRFACEEFVGGAWRFERGEFEGGGSRGRAALQI